MTPARKKKRAAAAERRGRWDRSKSSDERAGEQRTQIVYATARVVGQRGFANTRVEHVVAESGMSRRTIFKHFESMAELFLKVHEEAVDLVTIAIGAAIASASNPRERIRAGLDAYLAILEQYGRFAHAVLRESVAMGPRHEAARERLIVAVAEVIRDVASQFENRVVPSPTLAKALVMAIEAAAAVVAIEPDEQERRQARDALESMLLVGMGQKPL